MFIGRMDAEAGTPILWPPVAKNWLNRKDPDAEKDWRREEKGDDRGWDDWMPSPTRWTWVWVNSGSWWWTGNPGVLQSMGLQRVGHDWVTELNWSQWTTECYVPMCTQGDWSLGSWGHNNLKESHITVSASGYWLLSSWMDPLVGLTRAGQKTNITR